MTTMLLTLLGISLCINIVLFLVAYRLRSDKLTDASYALSFIVLSVVVLFWADGRWLNLVALLMVWLWAIRIGSFLLYRVLKAGKDSRFDGIREDFWAFGRFWFGQGLAVWVLLIPYFLVVAQGGGDWSALSWIGLLVWGGGFVVETIADLQKYRFTHNPAHKNQWITSGLWRYSRHPNYFGEILVWIGLYLFALPHIGLAGIIFGVLSPVFITVLLLFVSGIPPLEKSADKRWGNLADYQEYKRQTSILIPLRPKR